MDINELKQLPEELRRCSRWVTWRLETIEGRKRCKVPKNRTGRNADPTDPDDWSTLDDALGSIPKPSEEYQDDPCPCGIGLVIGPPYIGVDLDDCLEEGQLTPWAKDILSKIPRTYVEVTPSGKGLHLWYRVVDHAKLPDGHRTKKAEVYSRKRYFTVTGIKVPDTPSLLTELDLNQARTIFNIIDEMRDNKPPKLEVDEKLETLMTRSEWPNESEAVHALLIRLGYHFNCNRKVMEAEFKKSALYTHTKWNEKWDRLAERELDKAIPRAEEWLNRDKKRNKVDPGARKRGKVILASEVKPKVLNWLWQDRVPLGLVTIFAGLPGVGKSLLALDLVGRLSVGAQSVDSKTTFSPSKSLLLAIEDDRETITVPRLMGIGADLTKIGFCDMVEFLSDVDEVQDARLLNLESDLDIVREILKADPSYRLLVIDPLSNYMGGKSLYSDQETRSILMPVVALAQETGIAVVVVMHHSKQVGKSALEKIGSSIGGVGTARMAWSFFKDEEYIDVLQSKSNLGRFHGFRFTTKTIHVELEGKQTEQGAIEYVGESDLSADQVLRSTEDPEEQKEKAVVKLIKKHLPPGAEIPASVFYEAAEKAGIAQSSLGKASFELGIGKFRKGKVWMWRWMDESEKAPSESTPEEALF